MTKILGCFVLKYAEPKLPLEMQNMIVKYLRCTQLKYLLGKFPNKEWDWDFIKRKRYILIKNNIQWIEISLDRNNARWIFRWSTIVMDILNQYPQHFDSFIEEISNNWNITMEFVKQNINRDWNWNSVALNPNFTIHWLNVFLEFGANVDISDSAILLSPLSTKEKELLLDD